MGSLLRARLTRSIADCIVCWRIMIQCTTCGTINPGTPAQCSSCYAAFAAVATVGGAYASGTAPRKRSRPRAPDDLLLSSASGKLIALDVRTGRVRWWNQLGHQHQQIFAVVVYGSMVFALAESQHLFCIEFADGRTRWAVPTTSTSAAGMLVEDDMVFVVNGDRVDCYNTYGWRLWSQDLPGVGAGALWSVRALSAGNSGETILVD